MKRFKKITALILAVSIVLTALSVSSLACDAEYIDYSECLGLYTDVDGGYYLALHYYYGFNEGSQIKFYGIDKDGKRNLLKELTQEETNAFDYGDPISVSKDMFVENGKYVMVISNNGKATETDAFYQIADEYEFTYNDLKNKPLNILEYNLCITEGESIDLSKYTLIPVGYSGGITYETWNDDNYFADSYVIHFEDFAKVEGSVLTGLSNGAVYVDMYKDDGEYGNTFHVEILEKEPETIIELMEDSIKKLGEGWFNASVDAGTTFLGVVALILLPAILPFEIVFSILFQYPFFL